MVWYVRTSYNDQRCFCAVSEAPNPFLSLCADGKMMAAGEEGEEDGRRMGTTTTTPSTEHRRNTHMGERLAWVEPIAGVSPPSLKILLLYSVSRTIPLLNFNAIVQYFIFSFRFLLSCVLQPNAALPRTQRVGGCHGTRKLFYSAQQQPTTFFKDLFCIYTVSLGRSTSAAPAVQNLLSLHKER